MSEWKSAHRKNVALFNCFQACFRASYAPQRCCILGVSLRIYIWTCLNRFPMKRKITVKPKAGESEVSGKRVDKIKIKLEKFWALLSWRKCVLLNKEWPFIFEITASTLIRLEQFQTWNTYCTLHVNKTSTCLECHLPSKCNRLFLNTIGALWLHFTNVITEFLMNSKFNNIFRFDTMYVMTYTQHNIIYLYT